MAVLRLRGRADTAVTEEEVDEWVRRRLGGKRHQWLWVKVPAAVLQHALLTPSRWSVVAETTWEELIGRLLGPHSGSDRYCVAWGR